MRTVCPDMPGHSPAERLCDGCDKPLVGRQQRWCSDECSNLYWNNHRWGSARAVALHRRRVVRAGWRHRSNTSAWDPCDFSWPRPPAWRVTTIGYRCERCGCTTTEPEVNHRTPALGAHSRESCAHHQENLEVLCVPCHRAETKRQHAAGELRRHNTARTVDLSEQMTLAVAS